MLICAEEGADALAFIVPRQGRTEPRRPLAIDEGHELAPGLCLVTADRKRFVTFAQ